VSDLDIKGFFHCKYMDTSLSVSFFRVFSKLYAKKNTVYWHLLWKWLRAHVQFGSIAYLHAHIIIFAKLNGDVIFDWFSPG
jgi:hypothetical protein